MFVPGVSALWFGSCLQKKRCVSSRDLQTTEVQHVCDSDSRAILMLTEGQRSTKALQQTLCWPLFCLLREEKEHREHPHQEVEGEERTITICTKAPKSSRRSVIFEAAGGRHSYSAQRSCEGCFSSLSGSALVFSSFCRSRKACGALEVVCGSVLFLQTWMSKEELFRTRWGQEAARNKTKRWRALRVQGKRGTDDWRRH